MTSFTIISGLSSENGYYQVASFVFHDLTVQFLNSFGPSNSHNHLLPAALGLPLCRALQSILPHINIYLLILLTIYIFFAK